MIRWNSTTKSNNKSRFATASPKEKPGSTISNEAIAKRAYEKFLARGGVHGSHEQDWLEAERELKAEFYRADN